MDLETLPAASAFETAAFRAAGSGAFNAATVGASAAALSGPDAVREFVAGTFFSILLAEMQKTVPESPLCASTAESMFREMLNRQYASSLAQNARFPLVDQAIRQLGLENEEGNSNDGESD